MYKIRHDLEKFLQSAGAFALVEIEMVHGSTPREKGAWMLVSNDRTFRTIGGGQLENMAIEKARKLLSAPDGKSVEMRIPLGPHIGQCCGGLVNLRIARLGNSEIADLANRFKLEMDELPDVLIFGAGHVGKALAQALSLLPVKPILIDTRVEELMSAPKHVDTRQVAIPEAEVRNARNGSAFVILTHDHSLDFLIAREALARRDAAYVGMIGSRTKRATFRNWLRRENGNEVGMDQLVCPIGDGPVSDKRPEVIAALVVAEIVSCLDARANKCQSAKIQLENIKITGVGG